MNADGFVGSTTGENPVFEPIEKGAGSIARPEKENAEPQPMAAEAGFTETCLNDSDDPENTEATTLLSVPLRTAKAVLPETTIFALALYVPLIPVVVFVVKRKSELTIACPAASTVDPPTSDMTERRSAIASGETVDPVSRENLDPARITIVDDPAKAILRWSVTKAALDVDGIEKALYACSNFVVVPVASANDDPARNDARDPEAMPNVGGPNTHSKFTDEPPGAVYAAPVSEKSTTFPYGAV